MLSKCIEIGYHYQPNHWLEYYKDNNQRPFPVTDTIFPELLSLPIHPDISNKNIDFITSELLKYL